MLMKLTLGGNTQTEIFLSLLKIKGEKKIEEETIPWLEDSTKKFDKFVCIVLLTFYIVSVNFFYFN